MSPGVGPSSQSSGRTERGPVRSGVVGGLLAFAILVALGQLAAFAVDAATGRYRAWSWLKIGLVYLMSFCGVRVEVSTTTSAVYQVRGALLAGTMLGAWLLFRTGRTVSVRARTSHAALGAGWGRWPASCSARRSAARRC